MEKQVEESEEDVHHKYQSYLRRYHRSGIQRWPIWVFVFHRHSCFPNFTGCQLSAVMSNLLGRRGHRNIPLRHKKLLHILIGRFSIFTFAFMTPVHCTKWSLVGYQTIFAIRFNLIKQAEVFFKGRKQIILKLKNKLIKVCAINYTKTHLMR